MTFLKQWIGKPFAWIISGLLVVDLVSYFTLHSAAEAFFFWVVVGALSYVAVMRPRYILPIAIAEVIATSNGHALNISIAGVSVGLRMALFGLLVALVVKKVYKDRSLRLPSNYALISSLVAIALVAAVLIGYASGHSLQNIFLDANGYLAVFYVLAAWVLVRTSKEKRLALQGLAAGIAIMVFKTILFFLLFAHASPVWLESVYTWIRDTRLGEVTLITGSIYRIFLQGQIALIVAVLAPLIYLCQTKRSTREVLIVFGLASASLAISLSRSFAVALAGALLLLVPYLYMRFDAKRVSFVLVQLFLTSAISIAVLTGLAAAPITQYSAGGFFGSALGGRATGNDAAVDSRQLLLPPMLDAIATSPVTGNGLGATLTYTTRDPRYIESNGTDQVTTYAFEWGWFDFLVKFGVVGTLLFLVLLGKLGYDLLYASRSSHHEWLELTFLSTLTTVVTVHMFTPYLNHPLGWILLAMGALFVYYPGSKAQAAINEPHALSHVPSNTNPSFLVE